MQKIEENAVSRIVELKNKIKIRVKNKI